MKEETRVRESESILLLRRRVDEGSGARHPAGADHHDGRRDGPHDVVDRVAGLDVAAWRVDEHTNRGVARGRECKELRRYRARQARVHFAVNHHRSRGEERVGDAVEERSVGQNVCGFIFFFGHPRRIGAPLSSGHVSATRIHVRASRFGAPPWTAAESCATLQE